MITTNEARQALLTMDTATLEAFINEVDEYRRKYRWIPVEERLPPSNRKVLLYTERGAVFRGYYDHVHGCWRSTKTITVTHWRYPDGPELEESNEQRS